MDVPITAFYAGLLVLIAIALSQLVGMLRMKTEISINDGGNPQIAVAMRRQANFVESVPLALILLALVEINGLSATWLHVLGGTLVISRIVHPFGLHPTDMKRIPRLIGALGTFLVMLTLAIIAIAQGFSALF